MKTLKVLVVVALVVGLAGLVMSQDAPARPARAPQGVFGTVVKVDGTNIVVKQMARGGGEAKEVTVATDDKTEFVLDCEAAKLADLKAEMSVRITPATGTATKVDATSKGMRGAIVKVDGKNVVIKSGMGDNAKEVTVATDEKTKVFVGGKAAKLEDLKADMRVTVLPETGTAKKILAMAGAPASRPAAKEPVKE